MINFKILLCYLSRCPLQLKVFIHANILNAKVTVCLSVIFSSLKHRTDQNEIVGRFGI